MKFPFESIDLLVNDILIVMLFQVAFFSMFFRVALEKPTKK